MYFHLFVALAVICPIFIILILISDIRFVYTDKNKHNTLAATSFFIATMIVFTTVNALTVVSWVKLAEIKNQFEHTYTPLPTVTLDYFTFGAIETVFLLSMWLAKKGKIELALVYMWLKFCFAIGWYTGFLSM